MAGTSTPETGGRMAGTKNKARIPQRNIEPFIMTLRGQRVLLDEDLAIIFGVETKRLNEQVKRNLKRFPEDFSFVLTATEFSNLKSQNATSSWGGRRKNPRAFTEHGVIMAANVLNSPAAIAASVEVVRAFARLKRFVKENAALSKRIDSLEAKYDSQFKDVFDAFRRLMAPAAKQRPRIGFVKED